MDSYLDYLPSELLHIVSYYIGLKYDNPPVTKRLTKSYKKYISDIKSGFIEPFKRIKISDTIIYAHTSNNSSVKIKMLSKNKHFNKINGYTIINRLKSYNISFDHLDNIIYIDLDDNKNKSTINISLVFEHDNLYSYYCNKNNGIILSVSEKDWKKIWDKLSAKDKKNIILFNSQ